MKDILDGVYLQTYKQCLKIDHEILLLKLYYYGVCGISNNWFKSYFSDRKQFVSINGYDLGLAKMNCVPQGSVLGPLLLLHINSPNQATKFC